MRQLIALIQRNRFTAAMLLFVAIFYGAAIFGGAHGSASTVKPAPLSQSGISMNEEFKRQEELFEKNLLKRPGLLYSLSAAAFFAFSLGLFLDVRLLWGVAGGRRWACDGLPHLPVAWDLRHVLQAAVFMFFAESVLLIAETVFYLAVPTLTPPHDYLLMLNSILRDTMVALFILILVRRMGHKLADLGLTTKDFFKNILRGVLGYLAILPLLLVTLLALSALVKYFAYEPPPQNVVQIYLKKSSDPYLLFFTLFVAGAGPVIEEIFFRGFTYKAFRMKLGVWPGILLTAFIFAAFHLNITAFLPIFLIGILLSYLYEKTGSLVPSMTAHVLHNLLMVNFTLGFKSLIGS